MARYVVSGGLGVGKTSVLSLLKHRYETVAEPARALIPEHRNATSEATLDHRPGLFVDLLISRSIENHAAVSSSGVTVFDRGVPDCIAYAMAYDLNVTPALDAASRYRYENPVFVASPWEGIYSTDYIRRATFAEAEAFYSYGSRRTRGSDIKSSKLPKTSVEERTAFINRPHRSQNLTPGEPRDSAVLLGFCMYGFSPGICCDLRWQTHSWAQPTASEVRNSSRAYWSPK
jgi:predicted ATPase